MSTDGGLLPQSFVGDGVTGKAYESACFLAMGNNGKSGIFSGLDELMVVKMVSWWVIWFSVKLNNNENTGWSSSQRMGLTILLTDKYVGLIP